MNEEKYISCENITIAYDRKEVFENVSFEICKGDYICVVGENGTGKSTILKGLLGLTPIKSGKINFLNGCTKKDVGYLPQKSNTQKEFPASVREVVLSGCIGNGGFNIFYTGEEKKKAKKIMDRLGISDYSRKQFGNLSGGQQQRVCLARALMSTDKILVMDEPVTGLDPVMTSQFYEIIDKLNKEGLAIVMVSHDMENALKYSNKLLHMSNEGYFFGIKEEYIKRDFFEKN